MARDQFGELGSIMRSRAVRAKLAQVADEIAQRAETIASSEGAAVNIEREDGTRPKGRPYSRVSAPADQEFGTAYTKRRAILSRARQR